MAKEAFINWNPRGQALEQVRQAIDIATTYAAQGYTLTLRQLYYQFVARDLIANNQRSYKNLGGVIDKARLSGLMDWNYLVDRTRSAYRTDGNDESVEEAIQATADSYSRRLWEHQPWHVEVWVEKEALVDVVQQAASEVGVIYFACRGYVSQSEMYAAGKRFAAMNRSGKQTLLLHLGDHDPSGIDMTRDIQDRLHMFSRRWDTPEVKRIALNMDQIEEHQPPPNFAKVTDSRFEDYQAQYGDDSWELDALEPQLLRDLIVSEVRAVRDEDLWQEAEEQQEAERESLRNISANYDEIVAQGLA
jgi:hypothetical protein